MIETAADFLYVANARTGIRYDQTILPAVEAAGKVPCVDAYADLPYLVEMARERAFWTGGGGDVSNIVYNYDNAAGRLLDERTWYRGLCDAAITAINDKAESGICSLIPAAWSDASLSYPLVSYDYQWRPDCFHTWRRTMSVPRCAPSVVPRPAENDTLRRLFYDFSQMKRYMFDSATTITSVENLDYTAVGDDVVKCAVAYPRGGSPSGQATQWPYIAWTKDAAVTYYICGIRGYIKSPFLVNPSGSAYYGSMNVYALWYGDFGWKQYEQSQTESCHVNLLYKLQPATVTVDGVTMGTAVGYPVDFDGYATVSDYQTQQMIYQVRNAAKSYAESQGYNESGYYYSGSVILGQLIFDTGVIDHHANLPSAWTWTPPQTQA